MLGEILIQSLRRPEVYAHPTHDIHLVETHCAWVLLTGDFVYKIKKPVDFGFLDFSTLEKRRFFCAEEIRLNRRFAPDIYIDVVAISGNPEHPVLNGEGEAFEYAVRMRQFEENRLLSDLAASGALEPAHIDQLVRRIADFHAQADSARADDAYGVPEDINHWVRENYQHILPLLGPGDDSERVGKLRAWQQSEYERLTDALLRRKQAGAVRECHGDLHLGNITLIGDRVTPFDCIEFNAQLRWIDVISEVAFLLMDLDDRGQDSYAWRFLNGYLQLTGDYAGLVVLRYYLVYRAMVRAKVAILRRQQLDPQDRLYRDATDDYLQYLQLAEQYATGQPVFLMITHGLSGSGKSTLAAGLCERLGMLQLRSDVERKRQAGLAATADSHSSAGGGLYTSDRTRSTYDHLAGLAESVLAAGYSVVVDATFIKRAYRETFIELANRLKVPFVVLACVADDQELERRILHRSVDRKDASEATLEVLHAQQQGQEPLTADEGRYVVRIDTGQLDIDAVEAAVRPRIR